MRKRSKILAEIAMFLLGASTVFAGVQNTYERDAIGKNGVVAAARKEASQVGVDILAKGGNAVDAAVATAFAIGVLEPNASGIGGGGFMILRMADSKESIVIDYRETAPQKATSTMFTVDEKGKVLNKETSLGGKASGVPGNVAGLLTALEKYGTMSRKEVIEPAIDYARNGIEVTPNLAKIISDEYEKISNFPETEKIFLNDGLPFVEGEILKQTDLAKTLEIIVEKGKDGFYKGKIAQKIEDEIKKQGGILTKKDLKNYKVIERKPVEGTYRGYKIISTPPVSSGGTHVVQLLNMMENYDLKSLGDNTGETWHLWSEGMRRIFADRSEYMGDTDFIKVPLKGLLSKEYAKDLTQKFDLKKPSEDILPGNPEKYESESTTHFSVMDKEGNMVAITQTINYFFGSGVVIPETGILMNNEMADFDAVPNLKNSIKSGKRPLSSMSPTLVLDEQERPLLAIGSPGATRIIPAVALTISNIIDHGMNVQEAINAPRITQFQFGPLKLEGRVSVNAYKELIEMGHEVELKDDYSSYFGGVQAVMMNYDKKELEGGADPRRDGKAVGF